MRFKIPEHIIIAPVNESLVTTNNTTYNDRFFISDTNTERQFIINETTKIFIEKFIIPKTFQQVNKEIAAEIKAPVEEVKKIIHPFFKYIKHRQFLVPENYQKPVSTTTSLLNPAMVIDQYKIEQIIDAGDEVDIYKAVDVNSKKIAVIKLLKRPGRKKTREFKREFNFLKLLNKTAVVPKPQIFVSSKQYTYFSQDFINGLSFPQFIHDNNKLSRKKILKIITNILYAFKEIHIAGVVHGDIHPSNILITRERTIKIIDFGLALNSSLDKDELVNFGGVYYFMPPERIEISTHNKFSRKPDFYSDVFQIGVVLFMLLYDQYPFNGLTWEELATAIKEKQIVFPERSKHGFTVPAWLKDIITVCVSKLPQKRFTNAKYLYNQFLKNITESANKTRSAVKV